VDEAAGRYVPHLPRPPRLRAYRQAEPRRQERRRHAEGQPQLRGSPLSARPARWSRCRRCSGRTCTRFLAREFPSNINPQGQPFGLHCPPWRDQAEKQQYTGYTPGLPFFRCTTQYKPQIVDPGMNPIVDEARVYAGVWAILNVNLFSFGKNPPRPKKGVSIGLQGVMLIADDTKLAGGARCGDAVPGRAGRCQVRRGWAVRCAACARCCAAPAWRVHAAAGCRRAAAPSALRPAACDAWGDHGAGPARPAHAEAVAAVAAEQKGHIPMIPEP